MVKNWTFYYGKEEGFILEDNLKLNIMYIL